MSVFKTVLACAALVDNAATAPSGSSALENLPGNKSAGARVPNDPIQGS